MKEKLGKVNSGRTWPDLSLNRGTTLEKGVEATGPGNLSYGLLFTQSIVRTLDGGTTCSSLYNATPVVDFLEPKGLELECGSDMNITSCNDCDGPSTVISGTDSSAAANKSALGETP